jgi:glycosyltransferase involved in cell wall biosynthesis
MKILFVSNFLSHHQIGFCDELYINPNVSQFKFLSLEELPLDRKKLGYEFIFRPYEISNKKLKEKELIFLIDSFDVVIFGNAPEKLVNIRKKNKKVTFLYSERIFKESFIKIFSPYHFLKYRRKFSSKNFIVLAASSFLKYDLKKLLIFKKVLKWGYFPLHKKYRNKIFLSKSVKLLWVGRFIKWKKPYLALKLAKVLITKGIDFKLDLVGEGPLKNKLINFIKNQNLTKHVKLLGPVKYNKVGKLMESSDILLVTSDRNEGWGAVVNEGMASGCLVICSDSVGSARYLIEDNKTGLIFNSGDLKSLVQKTIYSINNPLKMFNLRNESQDKIYNYWNYIVASRRFVDYCFNLLRNDVIHFEEGPLSNDK